MRFGVKSRDGDCAARDERSVKLITDNNSSIGDTGFACVLDIRERKRERGRKGGGEKDRLIRNEKK